MEIDALEVIDEAVRDPLDDKKVQFALGFSYAAIEELRAEIEDLTAPRHYSRINGHWELVRVDRKKDDT